MSISLGTRTIEMSERTRMIEIATPMGKDPLLTIYRETVRNDNGVIFKDSGVAVVMRTLSQLADQSFTVGKFTLTGADLAEIIAGIADALRQEDLDKPSSSPIRRVPEFREA